ncbi:MAG: tetratricopeptide repeat protein [Blastocatellia bacterium]|nr:tetratricopeptide repeat protein [Blastocatellia bacterium]
MFIKRLIFLFLLMFSLSAKTNMLLAQNGTDSRIETAKQAVRNNPQDALAHNDLGMAYHLSGYYKEAIEAFKKSISLNPTFAEVHYNLGTSYYQEGLLNKLFLY